MSAIDLLPEELRTAIREGLTIVDESYNHDLAYRQRWVINRLFGPVVPQHSIQEVAIGKWRRFRLAVLTTEAVLPLWTRSFPDDQMPADCVAAAKQVMSGQGGEIEQLEQLRDEWWNHCGELVYEHQDKQNDALVGYAAIQTLRIALWDDLYSDALAELAIDEDIDPEDLDYAFSAAACWAEGTIWNESSSPARRHEFWHWWLSEAVPAAWLYRPGE
jgi:hypothetical protein